MKKTHILIKITQKCGIIQLPSQKDINKFLRIITIYQNVQTKLRT